MATLDYIMKYLPSIAGALLGLIFIVFGLNFFLKFLPTPTPEAGTPSAAFIGAMFSTSYLTFIKTLEIVGGVLTTIPKTRNFGLLILGPIVINILAFHIFLKGKLPLDPPIILFTILSAFLLWTGRKSFAKLLN